MRFFFKAVSIFTFISLFYVPFSSAAPAKALWSYWQESNKNNLKSISHTVLDNFLNTYVIATPQGINLIRYKNVSEKDRRKLKNYIEKLEHIKIRQYNRQEQLAYWINLYNAKTLDIVLDNYPVKSIRDINLSPIWKVWSRGPWDEKLMNIEGETLSLNDIEHRILRPIWHDPRIHYMINCASLGCPNLNHFAYSSKNISDSLTENAKRFINHPRAVQFVDGKLILSSIYHWFSEDFGANQSALLMHLQTYAKPELAEQLNHYHGEINYQYDWSLNQN